MQINPYFICGRAQKILSIYTQEIYNVKKFFFFYLMVDIIHLRQLGEGHVYHSLAPLFFLKTVCKCEATPLMDFQERNVVPFLCLIGFQLLSWIFFVFSFFCVFVCLFVSWCTKCFQLVKRLDCRQASSASTMSCGCI